MATGESIMKKMHEYEAKVLTALGFNETSPVVLWELSTDDGYVQFKWYGPDDPEVPMAKYRPGVLISADQEGGEPIRYTVPRSALAPEVWETIMDARREWESNFPAVRR